jgi:uncharacterized membrane protein YgcG
MVRVRLAGETLAAAVLLYSPWLAWNLVRFGELFPESGEAVRFMAMMYGDMELPFPTGAVSPSRVPLLFYAGNLVHALVIMAVSLIFFPVAIMVFLLQSAGQAKGLAFLGSWPVPAAVLVLGLVWARIWERKMDALFWAVLFVVAAYSFYEFGAWFFFRYLYPAQVCLLLLSAGMLKRAGDLFRGGGGGRRGPGGGGGGAGGGWLV